MVVISDLDLKTLKAVPTPKRYNKLPCHFYENYYDKPRISGLQF